MTMLQELRFDDSELIDLHVHSRWSDGEFLPEELVARAARRRLAAFALTDHAETRGVIPAILAGVRKGVHVIPGVELNSRDGDFLGLFVDIENESLLALLDHVREQRQKRFEQAVIRLREYGHDLDPDALRQAALPGEPSRMTIAVALVAADAAKTPDEAFERFLGPGGPARVEAEQPEAEDCLAAIRKAGGIAVEAHPHLHLWKTEEDPELHFQRMCTHGLLGYEYPHRTSRLPRNFLTEVDEAGLHTGLIGVFGSNFHGGGRTRARLGKPSMPGSMLEALYKTLPATCVHRNLFRRMAWRAANLTPEELEASLKPTPVVLREPGPEALLERPAPTDTAEGPGCPFVLVGPGAVERVPVVIAALAREGFEVIDRQAITGYPALSWDLYGLHDGTGPERRRDLLRFALDRYLYGQAAERCEVLFVDTLLQDPRPLKIRLRHHLGSQVFYRVRFGDFVDTFLTTWIHVPEPHNLALECARLTAFGVRIPDVPSRALVSDDPTRQESEGGES